MSRDQRNPDGGQRQQHRHRVAVDDQQNGEDPHDGGDLNAYPVLFADVLKVIEGAGRSGGVRRHAGSGHRLVDLFDGSLGGGSCLRGAGIADDVHRQQPGFAVLAGQDLPQRGGGHEVLHPGNILGVGAQFAHQTSVDRLIVGRQAVVVGDHHKQDVVGSTLAERLGDLAGTHQRRRFGRKDRCGGFLGQHRQRGEGLGQAGGQPNPSGNDQPRPAYDDTPDPPEDASTFGGRVRLSWQSVPTHRS